MSLKVSWLYFDGVQIKDRNENETNDKWVKFNLIEIRKNLGNEHEVQKIINLFEDCPYKQSIMKIFIPLLKEQIFNDNVAMVYYYVKLIQCLQRNTRFEYNFTKELLEIYLKDSFYVHKALILETIKEFMECKNVLLWGKKIQYYELIFDYYKKFSKSLPKDIFEYVSFFMAINSLEIKIKNKILGY